MKTPDAYDEFRLAIEKMDPRPYRAADVRKVCRAADALMVATADAERSQREAEEGLAGHVCFPYWTLAAVALFVFLVGLGVGLLAA